MDISHFGHCGCRRTYEHVDDAELSIDGKDAPRKPHRVSSVEKSDISLGCVTHGFPDGVDRLQRFHR